MEIKLARDEKIFIAAGERRASPLDLVPHDLVHVEQGRKQVAAKILAQRVAAADRQIRSGGHAQVRQRRQQIAGPLVFVERPVAHRILAAVDAMDQRVAQARAHRVGGQKRAAGEHVAFAGKRHADGVALRPAHNLQIRTVGPAAENQGRGSPMDHRSARPMNLMRKAPGAPIQPPVRSQAAAVHVVGDARVGKPGDQLLALVGHAVAVGVFQPPEAGRRRTVNGAVVPDNTLRKDQLVGEHRALVEAAVAVRVFEHANDVRRVFAQLRPAQIHARRIGHVHPPAIVEGGQHRPLDQRKWCGCQR